MAEIEAGITDGSDNSSFGFVNYTVSGDTSLEGDSILVTKLEDVIKHNDYDSTDTIGTTFYIHLCNPIPGNPLQVKAPKVEETRVYPNPNRGNVTVQWVSGDAYRVRLFNSMGQEQQLPNEGQRYSPMHLDLNHLPHGIYFLQLFNESGSKTVKLIKE